MTDHPFKEKTADSMQTLNKQKGDANMYVTAEGFNKQPKLINKEVVKNQKKDKENNITVDVCDQSQSKI